MVGSLEPGGGRGVHWTKCGQSGRECKYVKKATDLFSRRMALIDGRGWQRFRS